MPKKIKSIITYILTFGLCGFLIWYSLKDISAEQFEKIKFAIAHSNYFLLIPILIMGFISHWSRAVRWTYLMEPLGMNPKVANTFFAVMAGYLANMGIPRFGEVLKCSILAKYEKLSVDKLVGTIIAERAFDILCLIIIFFITFIVQIDLAIEYWNTFVQKFSNNDTGSHLVRNSFLFGIVLLIITAYLFRKKINNLAFFIKLKSIFKNIIAGIMSFRNMKNKKGFLFHTILIWSMYLCMIVLGFKSMEATSVLGFKAGFSVLSFGSIGMIATPGGMGAYTLLVDEIVRLYGIDKIFSFAISWIIWLVPTVIIILLGTISFICLPIYNKKNAQ